jgi:glycosyltransferase involved in cell wall biosynthesis
VNAFFPAVHRPSELSIVTFASIVIPLFNAKGWIAETLESIFAQELNGYDVEAIIVDDGSTDGGNDTASVLLKKHGIKHKLLRTENEGPSAARNRGWRNAAGQWIQFLDADDLLAPRKLALQIRRAREHGPHVAVLYSDWAELIPTGKGWQVSQTRSPRIGDNALIDLIRPECFLHLGSALVRRSFLERVDGFNQHFRLIEDVELLLRIAIAGGSFSHVPSPEPLFFYRRQKNSLSRQSERDFIEGCVRNADFTLSHLQTSGSSRLTRETVRVFTDVYSQAARFYFERDKARFNEIHTKILELDPEYRPARPAALRFLSGAIGYPRAEAIAVAYRKIKSWVSTP